MKAVRPLFSQTIIRVPSYTSPTGCVPSTQRRYAAKSLRPPPPRSSAPPTTRPPSTPPPAGAQLATQTAFKVRGTKDGDDDFTPQPLSGAIGMYDAPRPGENKGIDTRSLQKRRDDFVDYDKHLERRKQMTKKISKPYFRDWSNMRFHKGKVFVAPEAIFRAKDALFFPNFFGRTLRVGTERRDRKDGYRGLGKDTCEVMRGRISVVSLFGNQWAVNQAASFCSAQQNPALASLLKIHGGITQRVEINYEDNLLRYWILRLFGMRRLRNDRATEEQDRYFIVRRGMDSAIKEAIGFLNASVGYVYLVDAECRIRWAGSAIATDQEKEGLVHGLEELIDEARGAQKSDARPKVTTTGGTQKESTPR